MTVLEKEMSKLNTDGGFVMVIKTIFQLTSDERLDNILPTR